MASESQPDVQLDTRPTSRQLEMDALVGYLLLIGVLLSMALILAGLIWRFANTGSFSFDYPIKGMNFYEFTVNEVGLVLHGRFSPRVMLNAGIVTLMLTPYLRVLASMVYFMAGLKNWKYSIFTAVVLAVLTFSLFLR